MIPVFYAREMRECDRRMTEQRGVSGLELTRRAAHAVYQELTKRIAREQLILIVCGLGNNGGDGFALAEILAENGYRQIDVFAFNGKRSPDCAHYYERARNRVSFVTGIAQKGYGCIVDAVFGTGLCRAVEGEYRRVLEEMNGIAGAWKLAVDIPSGLNGDTGFAMGAVFSADDTVTFAGYKYGLLLNDGRDCAGSVAVKDIGIENAIEDCAFVMERQDIKRYFPKRKINSHKGDYGRCAILAGSAAYFGAGVLSAVSALRAGAGYCYLGCPSSLANLYRISTPEVIVREMPDGSGNLQFGEEEIKALLHGATGVAIGMGLGVSEEVYRTICYILKNYDLPVLIDADGLNALSEYGLKALKNTSCRVILTPHPGEFTRLAGGRCNGEAPAACAKSLAQEYGVTVLLKGATTVITDGKRCVLNITGSPALAKGGSGDVLSGVCAALLARGVPPFEAGVAASYLFGRAGELAAAAYSEYAPLAGEVAELLGKAIQKIIE